jgi:hypothetical protein
LARIGIAPLFIGAAFAAALALIYRPARREADMPPPVQDPLWHAAGRPLVQQ